jgi:fumarate hydratase subunit beta
MKELTTPISSEAIAGLGQGDLVLLSGKIFTARDQAHLRLSRMIENKEKLPIDIENNIIYYCGPTPKGEGVIGSCGPTTSSRMDAFTPVLLEKGLKGMIGKGRRSGKVKDSIEKNKAVYFAAPAGCGAYIAKKVISSKVVAFDDLGPEAIYELEVKSMPLVVVIDSEGNDLYKQLQ